MTTAICNYCDNDCKVLCCNNCKKNGCIQCIVKYTSDNKFIHRVCKCGSSFDTDMIYNAFDKDIDIYIDTILTNKVNVFKESPMLLDEFITTYKKHNSDAKIVDDLLSNIQKEEENGFQLDKTKIGQMSDKLSDMNAIMKTFKSRFDNIFKTFHGPTSSVVFNNYSDTYVHDKEVFIEELYQESFDILDKIFMSTLQSSVSSDKQKKRIDKLYKIRDNIIFIMKRQECLCNFKHYKEIKKCKLNVDIIKYSYNFFVNKSMTEKTFLRLLKITEIEAEKYDYVLASTYKTFSKVENIRLLIIDILRKIKENNHLIKNQDVKTIDNIVNEFKSIIPYSSNIETMMKRYNMTNDRAYFYWTMAII